MRAFREFTIIRNCNKEYKQYSTYKPHLKNDFKNRCAYCNILDSSITTPFEVDHFIPKNTFKHDWPECDTLYGNLMYSCKKCNGAKSDQYSGVLDKENFVNDEFYNPVDSDLGEIFFRNEVGGIDSEDKKGKEMIQKIKLYRPIHNLAWIVEKLQLTLENINKKLDTVDRDTSEGRLLLLAKERLSDYYLKCQQTFLEIYNDDSYEFSKN